MKRRRRRTQARQLGREDFSVVGEADYIVARAVAGEARVVSLPPLVFVSTGTGDAWLLDADDSLALCLALEGTRLPVTITETPERFAIEWTGTFRIEGDMMIFSDNLGRPRTIIEDPTRQIAAALERARA